MPNPGAHCRPLRPVVPQPHFHAAIQPRTAALPQFPACVPTTLRQRARMKYAKTRFGSYTAALFFARRTMKRLLLVLGLATVLNACGGKDNAPGLAPVIITGGSTTTGGRSHTGGTGATTGTGTAKGGAGTSVGGIGTSTGGVGGTSGTSAGASSIGGITSLGGTNGTNVSTASTGGGDLSPVVMIVSPPATVLPPDDTDAGADAGTEVDVEPVVVDSMLNVRCQADMSTNPGAANIASVQLEVKPAGGSVTQKQGTIVQNTNDVYSATFAMADVPVGSIDVGCLATDQAAPARTGSATITTYVDHGPIISDIQPVTGTAFPVNTPVTVSFKATPDPLVPGDTGADIGTESVVTSDVDIPVQPDHTRNGYFTGVIHFDDTTKFSAGRNGQIAIEITATNKRKNPKPASASQSVTILLDGEPPAINITSPAPTTVIGGQVQLNFTVTDDLAGVDPAMVVVNLGASQPVSYSYKQNDPAWKLTHNGLTDTFTFTFDSTKFDSTDSQVTVSISAADFGWK